LASFGLKLILGCTLAAQQAAAIQPELSGGGGRTKTIMPSIIRLLVELTIYHEKFDAFNVIAREMTAGSELEPGTLSDEWFLSSDRRRCRLIETYADANALLAHFNGPVVQEMVPKLIEQSRLERFEVYGDPGPEAQAVLAGFGAEIFQPWHTLSR
jgi:quinol monooxygenase YgiN